jgi:hypothetical protein
MKVAKFLVMQVCVSSCYPYLLSVTNSRIMFAILLSANLTLHAIPLGSGKFYSCGTNSTQLSPSGETASCLATQEFPNILWKRKVHCRVQKAIHWFLYCILASCYIR